MKTLIFISITISLFSMISCESDRFIQRIGLLRIENYDLPDTAFLNETISASFKASAGDGCWSDLYIDFKETDNYEYSVKAYGTFSCFAGGCACPQNMVYHDTIINFQPDQRGTYIFRIQKNHTNITVDTLIVE